MNAFKYSSKNNLGSLSRNTAHQFAMQHSMMLYSKNALYSFIPKNACSTLRLSVALENGCIDSIKQGHWIHHNNNSFNATLGEATTAAYSFVILRCPYRRLASVYLDKFIAKEPDAWHYRDLQARQIELDDLSFRDFVKSLKSPTIFNANIHWRPQVEFLIYKRYSDYFCLEDFSGAIKTLRKKIGFKVVDARSLTQHGTHHFKLLNKKIYADTAAFDIATLKRKGKCPSHQSLYDDGLIRLVRKLYKADLKLYTKQFGAKHLLFPD